MKPGLWEQYLRLQTVLAYGESIGSSPPSEAQSKVAVALLGEFRERPGGGSLVIGPGGPNEVRQLLQNLNLPRPMSALTAHEPEARILREAFGNTVIADHGDLHDMPYESGAFSYLFASNVLEHALAPYVALLECRRVLAPRGRAHFVMPSFAGREGGRGPFHLHCLTAEVWRELLRKTGLAIALEHIAPGGEDPSGHYVHFVCEAHDLPAPHDRMLRELVAFKRR